MSALSDPRDDHWEPLVDLFSVKPAPEGSARRAKHDLVAETRRLIDLVALLDTEATGAEALAAIRCAVQAAADLAEEQPRLGQGLALTNIDDGALLERSGIAGRSNPLAAPVQFALDEDGITRGTATFGAAYEGPPSCVHGGFVAAAFDDLLGYAQRASGTAGYTGTLTVRMRRPHPLHKRIDYEAGVKRHSGRKIVVWGTSHCEGELLADCEILFVTPKDHHPPDPAHHLPARTGRDPGELPPSHREDTPHE